METYTVREFSAPGREHSVFGLSYMPKDWRGTTVLFSHELGRNHTSGIPYAEYLAARGYEVCVFDFFGGSIESVENRTGRDTTKMTVLTEKDDLDAVLSMVLGRTEDKPERIVLLGASQGGFVSLMEAEEKGDLIAGLIMMYPALLIWNDAHSDFLVPENVPETYTLWNGWIRLGRKYALDVWNYDPYRHMPNVKEHVLLMHGLKDPLVDIAFSERASRTFPDCEFYKIAGGGHGFTGAAFLEAAGHIEDYLKELEATAG